MISKLRKLTIPSLYTLLSAIQKLISSLIVIPVDPASFKISAIRPGILPTVFAMVRRPKFGNNAFPAFLIMSIRLRDFHAITLNSIPNSHIPVFEIDKLTDK